MKEEDKQKGKERKEKGRYKGAIQRKNREHAGKRLNTNTKACTNTRPLYLSMLLCLYLVFSPVSLFFLGIAHVFVFFFAVVFDFVFVLLFVFLLPTKSGVSMYKK